MAGCRRRDAAQRQGALPDQAPVGEVALGRRTLALELLDGGKRVLAQPRGFHALGRVDHLVEHHLYSLRPRLARAFQDAEQIWIARSIARERELGHAPHGELLDVVALVRPWKKLNDAVDRTLGSGGEIITP